MSVVSSADLRQCICGCSYVFQPPLDAYSIQTPYNFAMNSPTLTIDVVSDVVCPWCYIGKRKLETALTLPEAQDLPRVVVRWHPFQLNPDLPAQGISRKQYLEDKFGGPQRAAEIYERVRAAGQAVGLALNIDGITLQPNTLAAHALIAFAQQGDADGNDIKERLLKAYFVDNRFIGSMDVLTDIAQEPGLHSHHNQRIRLLRNLPAMIFSCRLQARQ